MKITRTAFASTFSCLASIALTGSVTASPIQHVLLISIDGMHQTDLQNYIVSHPGSTLAQLRSHGVVYTHAYAARPSDSFPGLMALITGGTPKTTGVWYDNSYDRTLLPPGGGAQGTQVLYDESIDINPNALDGGGGIDPAKLPQSPGTHAPLYPHDYLRVNTIFQVAKTNGLYTAWSDKHPAYDIVNGPSALGPKGVDDLFTPEIAAGPTTNSVVNCNNYDDIKVQAILNEISGKDHMGSTVTQVPAIFGMNFQAVSVGQKVSKDSVIGTRGGYADALGTPTPVLQTALDHIDGSLGLMVGMLNARNLASSTLIIVTAKHGQSPIDFTKLKKIGDVAIPALIGGVQSGLLAQQTADDSALIWLNDQSKTGAVAQTITAHRNDSGVMASSILSGASLKFLYDDPTLDPRTPDVIVQPQAGVLYSFSGKKIAEHGGFTDDDTHVALLVSNPAFTPTTFDGRVFTTQVAPTILKELGLNPSDLLAVQKEGTPVLPGF